MIEALATWLVLRESSDAAARSERLTRMVADVLPAGAPASILDLATGGGSNIRYLSSRLPSPQRWLAVDQSPVLLTRLRHEMSAWGAARGYAVQTGPTACTVNGAGLECDVETHQMDLGELDEPNIFTGRHLVTASALLDLVSEPWLRVLAARCRAARAAALFTITYDGHFTCSPAEPEDTMVRSLLNEHQKRDKGLGGPAQGPDAVACAERCFVDAGYLVHRESSDWTVGPEQTQMQRMLIDGWAEAAAEVTREGAPVIADWRARRLAHVDAGRSRAVVGHEDLAALLPEQ